MSYEQSVKEWMDDLHDAIYGNGNEPECDYENHTIGYNEDGETYFWVDVFCNGGGLKGISLCAYTKSPDEKENPSVRARVGLSSFNGYETIDYIVEHRDELEEQLNRRFEEEYARKMKMLKENK